MLQRLMRSLLLAPVCVCLIFVCPAVSGKGNGVASGTEENVSPSSSSNPDAYFTSGLYPGEGIPTLRANKDLEVHVAPHSTSARVAELKVKKGQIVNFDRISFQTIRPVTLKLEQDQTFEDATDYGPVKSLSADDYYDAGRQRQLSLKKGDEIKVLQYRAEGAYLVEVNGNVMALQCSGCSGVRPVTQCWVRITDGARFGWILSSHQNTAITKREF